MGTWVLRVDLTPNVDCVNLARNGRSSKSYYDEGIWQNVLAQHADYILIQFGHNDMPGKGPARETDPETTYAANMRRYIDRGAGRGSAARYCHVALAAQL